MAKASYSHPALIHAIGCGLYEALLRMNAHRDLLDVVEKLGVDDIKAAELIELFNQGRRPGWNKSDDTVFLKQEHKDAYEVRYHHMDGKLCVPTEELQRRLREREFLSKSEDAPWTIENQREIEECQKSSLKQSASLVRTQLRPLSRLWRCLKRRWKKPRGTLSITQR